MVFRWSRYPASIAAGALFCALRYLSLSIVSPVFLATLARWSRLRSSFQTGAFNQAGRLLRLDVNLDGMHSSMAAEIACMNKKYTPTSPHTRGLVSSWIILDNSIKTMPQLCLM